MIDLRVVKMLVVLCLTLALLSILFITRKNYLRQYKCSKNICVVVLGDVGRSPRMQYHAISFAKQGYTVDIIGYPGSQPMQEINQNTHISVYYLLQPPELQNSMNWILYELIYIY